MKIVHQIRITTTTALWAAAAALLIATTGLARTPSRPRIEAMAADDGQITPQSPAESSYMPGQVLVKLKSGSAQKHTMAAQDATAKRREEAILARLQDRYGFDRQETTAASRLRGRRRYHLLQTDLDVPTVCAQLRNDPDVQYAQPNYIYHICQVPDDPDFPDQYAHQLIQMPDAWDISTGSRDVVVAVLGTGVDVNHPDLKDNIWINPGEIPDNDVDDDENGYIDDVYGWNFEDGDNDVIPEEDYYDIGGHETMVAGVIAATGNNGEGVCGINWQCSLMVLRLSLYITTAEVAEGLDYAAANGADILNMSFGADEFGAEGDPIVKEAIDNAFAQGVLLFASAGNSDNDYPNYPAAYPNVVAVSSTDGEDIKTGHSSFGSWVDIAAPGTDIVTTDLNGQYIATAGTSFSSPYVAAVGALVLSHRPDLSHVEIRAILENTTDPVYYGDVDPVQGYVGTGRVNAYTALLNADVAFPVGEIAEPRQAQTLEADVNNVELVLLAHGQTYTIAYSAYGADDWTPIDSSSATTDDAGLVHITWPNPGPGVYELRLQTMTDGRKHTDRKMFAIGTASNQTHWPKPETADELDDFLYIPEDILIGVGHPICMDVDGDGRNEIVQPSISLDDWYYAGKVNIWKEDGTSLPNWPQPMELWVDSSCAVGDVDGDGDYEVIAVSNYDALIYAWHVDSGELLDGDWPMMIGGWYGSIVGHPVLADLDGDGDSEIVAGLDTESDETDGLYALQGDGTSLWQRRYTTEGPLSAADFDGDGNVEIALCGYGPGVSNVYTYILDNDGQLVKKWRDGSPKGTAIVDLDGDGELELICCTEDSVRALHIDGSTLWSSRVYGPFGTEGTLSVGDVDGDGKGEIFVTAYIEADGFAYTLLYMLDNRGRLLTDGGFPKTIMGWPGASAPLIADVDGDGQRELLTGLAYAPLMAWEADGSTTAGFPMLDLATMVDCAPALGDLDQDGDVEIMVAGDDYRFQVKDMPGSAEFGRLDWPMARHDAQNSAWASLAPTLEPLSAPSEIAPGERLELTLTASNPGGQSLRFSPGQLPEGAYYEPNGQTVTWKPTADQTFKTYTFSFLVTDGVRQSSRSVSVTVVPKAIYATNMDVDPNWQFDEGWSWGTPTGEGSRHGDPLSGHTGETVVGYALDGDYADGVPETRYATTGPIDCQGYTNVRLSFWRWLGVESPYDYANVQVSSDGTTWVDLWTTGYAHIDDGTWRFVEYAVPSAIADGQATVYFRWGIGPTDDSVTYAGWNIDDVQVTGDLTP
ncbi:MAG: S8 family serine peptidase [Phycisphaerales bacterium]|nr:MAG: S8 family serine peptidase [Phycisphaerales bacterium]